MELVNYPIISFGASRRSDAHDNTIIDGVGLYETFAYNAESTFFQNNTLVDSTTDVELISNNYAFTNAITSNNLNGNRAEYTQDYTFTSDKFTNSPRIITLPNVVK